MNSDVDFENCTMALNGTQTVLTITLGTVTRRHEDRRHRGRRGEHEVLPQPTSTTPAGNDIDATAQPEETDNDVDF